METQIISNHKQHKPVSLICITKLEGQVNLAQVWGFMYAYIYIFYIYVCVHVVFANTNAEIHIYLYKNNFSSSAKQTIVCLVINPSRNFIPFQPTKYLHYYLFHFWTYDSSIIYWWQTTWLLLCNIYSLISEELKVILQSNRKHSVIKHCMLFQ